MKGQDVRIPSSVTARLAHRKPVRQRDAKKTEEELEAAYLKLKNQGQKITAAAVAEIVGVDPSLIPHAYGRIHQLIKKAKGRSESQQLDAAGLEIAELRRRRDEAVAQKDVAERQVTRLTSINATLDELIKDQARELADALNATGVQELAAERQALISENSELRQRVAELQAQVDGKLAGRIGRSRPPTQGRPSGS